MLENNQITEECRKINQRVPRSKWQWKLDESKSTGCSKNSGKREVYSNTSLPQETRETSNKQSKSTLTAARKRRTATTTKNQSY